MSTLTKQPNLRFLKFNDQWKEKKLRDLFVKKNKKNTDNKEFFILTNSATQGIVAQRDFFNKDIANRDNLTGYYIVDINDFVYNPRISKHAPVGPLKRNKLMRGIMSPLYTPLKPKIDFLDFLEYYFNTKKWNRYMLKIANYGARHDRMNIAQNDFFDMPILLPTIAEQQNIANFLTSVNKWIKTLRSQKESLEAYKKGIMQKIFSQEIRFKDDDGGDFINWREEKLEYFLNEHKMRNTQNKVRTPPPKAVA